MSGIAAFASCLPPPCASGSGVPWQNGPVTESGAEAAPPVEAAGPAAGAAPAMLGLFSPRKYAKAG
jgi:hypothetical protein